MSSKKPIVRQAAVISILIQYTLLMTVIFTLRNFMNADIAIGIVLLTYLIILILVRNLVARSHRKGIRYFKNSDYSVAIEEFKKSYLFFTKHKWIDKFRYITLLSSSRISYTEMALINIAFCYSQIGNAELSKQYYNEALTLFPDSEMAKSALNLISSVENGIKKNLE